MKRFAFLVLFVGLTAALLTPVAGANAVVFTASGVFDNGDTLSGEVTIDTITGNALSANLMVSGHPDPFAFVAQGTWPPVTPFMTELSFLNGQSTDNLLTFLFEPDSLVGYTGGLLCGLVTANCQGQGLIYRSSYATDSSGLVTNIVELNSGALAPAPAPEPGSLLLFGSGLIGAAGALRRKLLG